MSILFKSINEALSNAALSSNSIDVDGIQFRVKAFQIEFLTVKNPISRKTIQYHIKLEQTFFVWLKYDILL